MQPYLKEKGNTMNRLNKPFGLSKTSQARLEGVDPRLVSLVHEILWYMDVSVIEGLRSVTQQQQNVKKGVSKTMKSKHLVGKAIDLYPYPIPRLADGRIDSNAKVWNTLGRVGTFCAGKLGYPEIFWGGFWTSLIDKPHFEIEEE